MTALIVEDIRSTSDLIKQRIILLTDKISIIDQAFTTQEAYQKIINFSYDIVFWDINMSSGTSFDILKKLSEENKINFESIFITGQKESDLIINALKFSAIDYLFKPIDDSQLIESIEKAVFRRESKTEFNQYVTFMSNLDNYNSNTSMAFSLIKGSVVFLEINNITFLEAEGVVTKIYLNDLSTLYANKNLGFYKPILSKEKGFFLASHSAIVNMNHIEKFDSKSFLITFQNKLNVSVSRRRVKEFKTQMIKFKSQDSFLSKLINRIKNSN